MSETITCNGVPIVFDSDEETTEVTDKTCKTCRWWDRGGTHGTCERISCGKYHTDSDMPRDAAWSREYIGEMLYMIEPHTGPDFGCIHWEQDERRG